jgi:two-component system KDP operon response regulator KdpE
LHSVITIDGLAVVCDGKGRVTALHSSPWYNITGQGVNFSMNEREKKQLVLVVDDEPKVLRFVQIDLKVHGFDVITTTSGEEALELIKSKKPDIVLMDIIMPGMDGFEVLKKLRDFSQLPIIVFSASVTNRDEAMRLSASDFMAKPFRPDEMVRRIESLLNR